MSMVSAEFMYDNPKLPKITTGSINSNINYSTVNVNNSNFLNGLTSTQIINQAKFLTDQINNSLNTSSQVKFNSVQTGGYYYSTGDIVTDFIIGYCDGDGAYSQSTGLYLWHDTYYANQWYITPNCHNFAGGYMWNPSSNPLGHYSGTLGDLDLYYGGYSTIISSNISTYGNIYGANIYQNYNQVCDSSGNCNYYPNSNPDNYCNSSNGLCPTPTSDSPWINDTSDIYPKDVNQNVLIGSSTDDGSGSKLQVTGGRVTVETNDGMGGENSNGFFLHGNKDAGFYFEADRTRLFSDQLPLSFETPYGVKTNTFINSYEYNPWGQAFNVYVGNGNNVFQSTSTWLDYVLDGSGYNSYYNVHGTYTEGVSYNNEYGGQSVVLNRVKGMGGDSAYHSTTNNGQGSVYISENNGLAIDSEDKNYGNSFAGSVSIDNNPSDIFNNLLQNKLTVKGIDDVYVCTGSLSSCSELLTPNTCNSMSGCSWGKLCSGTLDCSSLGDADCTYYQNNYNSCGVNLPSTIADSKVVGSCVDNPILDCSTMDEGTCSFYQDNYGVCQVDYSSGQYCRDIGDEPTCDTYSPYCQWDWGNNACRGYDSSSGMTDCGMYDINQGDCEMQSCTYNVNRGICDYMITSPSYNGCTTIGSCSSIAPNDCDGFTYGCTVLSTNDGTNNGVHFDTSTLSGSFNNMGIFNGNSGITISSASTNVNSVSLWVYINSCQDSQFITKGNDAFDGAQWDWSIWTDGSCGLNYEADVYQGVNAGYISPSTWHNIVLVRNDGSNSQLYLDNSLVYTGTAGSGNSYEDTIRIGQTGGYYFNGYMDDIALFSTALSSTAVNNIYTSGVPLTGSESGLIALYHLDETDSCSTTGTCEQINANVNNQPPNDCDYLSSQGCSATSEQCNGQIQGQSCNDNPSLDLSGANESTCLFYQNNYGVCQNQYSCSGTLNCNFWDGDQMTCEAHPDLCNWDNGMGSCNNMGNIGFDCSAIPTSSDPSLCNSYNDANCFAGFSSCSTTGSCSSIASNGDCANANGCSIGADCNPIGSGADCNPTDTSSICDLALQSHTEMQTITSKSAIGQVNDTYSCYDASGTKGWYSDNTCNIHSPTAYFIELYEHNVYGFSPINYFNSIIIKNVDTGSDDYGEMTIERGASYDGQVLCFVNGGKIGHCTDLPTNTGGCTCVEN
jgi:hypothetical protein